MNTETVVIDCPECRAPLAWKKTSRWRRCTNIDCKAKVSRTMVLDQLAKLQVAGAIYNWLKDTSSNG